MPDTEAIWEQVHPRLRRSLRRYVRLLRELGGDGVKALTLFGPAASADFDPDDHTARNVLIVDHVDLAMLRRLSEQGPHLGKEGIAAPLVMTPTYIRASLDTFPLELMEIQDRHLTLFGADPFEGIVFQDAHVRLQCERELKALLIGLRQGLLVSAGRDRFIHALGHETGERLRRTLRGLIWLKGKKDVKAAATVFTDMETLADRKLPGLRAALDEYTHLGWEEFQQLYHDVEALGELVNAW